MSVETTSVDDVPVGTGRRGITRAEQAAATRRRLLDAAVECLYELGYARTTTVEVQARSGVSRGSLLHQFASRNDLLMAAVEHLGAEMFADLRRRALDLPHGAAGFDVAVDVMADLVFAPTAIAAIELWNASRTDEELAVAVRRHEPIAYARLITLFDLSVGPGIVADPRYPPIRHTLIYAMVGSALGRHLRPEDWLEREIVVWKELGRELG